MRSHTLSTFSTWMTFVTDRFSPFSSSASCSEKNSKWTVVEVTGKLSRDTSSQHLARPNPFTFPPHVYSMNTDHVRLKQKTITATKTAVIGQGHTSARSCSRRKRPFVLSSRSRVRKLDRLLEEKWQNWRKKFPGRKKVLRGKPESVEKGKHGLHEKHIAGVQQRD